MRSFPPFRLEVDLLLPASYGDVEGQTAAWKHTGEAEGCIIVSHIRLGQLHSVMYWIVILVMFFEYFHSKTPFPSPHFNRV